MMLKDLLAKFDIDIDSLSDENIKAAFIFLFNIIEDLSLDNQRLREEAQRLRDENNRLKGEQGKPKIRPNVKKDISSEQERKKEKQTSRGKRGKKKDKIKIDREEKCRIDKTSLPPDAKFKGYQEVVVQDIIIKTDNVLFRKEIYYSPSQKKTYIAPNPPGYEGEFGPTIKSSVIIFKNVCNMSESKILGFLRAIPIYISAGQLSNMLIKDKQEFHQEKQEIIEAGLESNSSYQRTDDTKARVNGENWHTHILGNQFYSSFTTMPKKDRLTVLKILLNGCELKYCLNDHAFLIMEQLKVGKKYIDELRPFVSEKVSRENEFEQLLDRCLPEVKPIPRHKIIDAAAIAWYSKGVEHPVVDILLCDDAPQFKLLTKGLALCWVHDGRHYKKLNPVVVYNANKIDDFLSRYWQFYKRLEEYKCNPSEEFAEILSTDFDELFSMETKYNHLDDRIQKTLMKKKNLLMVLQYPELPLHNNESELDARLMVRKRDVSLHTITEEGTKANDTFATIVQTGKKYNVNVYEYLFDRITKSYKLKSLAQMIRDKQNELN